MHLNTGNKVVIHLDVTFYIENMDISAERIHKIRIKSQLIFISKSFTLNGPVVLPCIVESGVLGFIRNFKKLNITEKAFFTNKDLYEDCISNQV